jgi:hypothetical protein
MCFAFFAESYIIILCYGIFVNCFFKDF